MSRSTRSRHRQARPLDVTERVLVGAELLLALGGLGGSVGVLTGVIDFGSVTSDLPFQSPVLAGVALGVLNGLIPLVAAVGTLRRTAWAPIAHVVVGTVLMGWIVVQVGFIGLGSWLQPFYFVYGAVVTSLALWNLHRREPRPGHRAQRQSSSGAT